MRRIDILWPAICLAAAASAQVLSPPEIRDLKMRDLQQQHMADLKTVAATISSHSFPYRLYFSRVLDLNEGQQQRADQRSIRFDKFGTQTVLQITANYYASYSAELMKRDERARKTLHDVTVPILQAAVPVLIKEEKVQAFAIEISHHVRRKVLGVSTENPENVALILPRLPATQLVAAKSPAEQDAALMQGMLFIDGKPVDGWGPRDAEQVAENTPSPTRPDAKPVIGTTAWSSVPQLPGEAGKAATPPARLAAEPKPEVTADVLRKLQSSNQAALDTLVRELDKTAHFVSYAPPTFIVFHKGAYLQLSMTTTLRESDAGSQYRVAALAFDEHIAHLVRPVLASLQTTRDFDGIDFSTSVRLAGAGSGSGQSVEFIFPTAALTCYEQYDCTGQQLINQGFVLINGERVGLDLQSAETRVEQR
jgi:hypothetical protein